MIVIYSILNICNYKRYIGSTNNFNRRKREHLNSLRKKTHYNKHLQRAWDYYGEEYFEFEIIEEIEHKEKQEIREEFWIDYFNSYKYEYGYNTTQYPEQIGNYKWSEEEKEKQRQRKLGISLSEEHKENISNSLKGMKKPDGFGEYISTNRKGENNPNYGKHLSEETKDRIRKGNLGKKHTEESKIKIGIANKNIPKTEEQINLLRTINIGRKHTEEFKLKISNLKKGIKFSEEHRKNMSLARLGEKHINSKLKNEDINCIKYLLNYNILSQSEIARMFKVIPQTINDIYKNRTWTHITTFTNNEADVRVLNVLEGTGKNVDKLGSITIQFEYQGQLYECNCGSGFSDEERDLYWKNPKLLINKIVTVGYFEVSKNQQDESYGLRFPTWKGIIRNDKTEISMH